MAKNKSHQQRKHKYNPPKIKREPKRQPDKIDLLDLLVRVESVSLAAK